jgi:hypothetical protein
VNFDLPGFAAHVAKVMNTNVEKAKEIALEVGAGLDLRGRASQERRRFVADRREPVL